MHAKNSTQGALMQSHGGRASLVALCGKESACNARDPYSSGTFLSVKYAAETKIPVLLVLSF